MTVVIHLGVNLSHELRFFVALIDGQFWQKFTLCLTNYSLLTIRVDDQK